MAHVLVVGESWVSHTTHTKGFDGFESTTYETGVGALRDALEQGGHEVTHLPGHLVPTELPFTLDGLAKYEVILLSDVGADTILLAPQTFLRGETTPNRLALLKQWTLDGGGLAMAGGYLSFQGIYGRARYRGTPIEDVLPCTIEPFDDRVEAPEGAIAELRGDGHPVTAGVDSTWPPLLGYNRVQLREEAQLLAEREGDVLLATRSVGAGRTLIWTSDIGPHWCPQSFIDWQGYTQLWGQAVTWLAG